MSSIKISDYIKKKQRRPTNPIINLINNLEDSNKHNHITHTINKNKKVMDKTLNKKRRIK